MYWTVKWSNMLFQEHSRFVNVETSFPALKYYDVIKE